MSLAWGIDCSNWQGNIGWEQVAASGVQFAICKSSEGTTYRDPYFPMNWAGMGNTYLQRGAYHFAQPDQNGPDAEAAYFLDAVRDAGGLNPGDVLALDMEAGSGNLHDWTVACLAAIEAAVGFKALLYSGAWFMSDHGLTNSTALAAHGLWIASYGSIPQTPPYWAFSAIWQFTCEGTVPGIAGPVDLNVYNGPIESLASYGLPG